MFGSVDSQDYEDITNEMIIKAPITDICIVVATWQWLHSFGYIVVARYISVHGRGYRVITT